MSLGQVKSVIKEFIKSDESSLLIIKGKWGVGKTYFWQELIKNLKIENEPTLKNYAYVSLFGIDSVESLKNLITASFLESKLLPNKKQSQFKNFFLEIPEKLQKLLSGIPYIKLVPLNLANDLAFLAIRDTLICFDDIERKGKNFNIESLIGLSSLLKEQKNCKIVFILNDEKLSDKEEFDKLNEKIVDIEVAFKPLSDEVFNYIFSESHPYFELIKFSCVTLQIKNIRILQRIKFSINYLLDELAKIKKVEKLVAEDIIRSIILFIWSYYDKDSQTLSLDFLDKYNDMDLYIKKNLSKEKVTEEDERKHKLLTTYRFGQTDNLDRELISYVKQGFLDEKFFDELELKNEQFVSQLGKNSYKEVWELYKTSFELEEDEFEEKLISAFYSNAKYLELVNLYDTISILRLLNRDEKANDLIDAFLPKLISYEQVIQLKANREYFDYYKDEYFLKKLNEIPKPSTENYRFDEILRKLISENRYYGEEISFLASCEDNEYYNFFKTEKSSYIYYGAKYLLSLGRMNTEIIEADVTVFNLPQETKKSENSVILEKTKKALLQIASESRINRLRVSGWFNLEIN